MFAGSCIGVICLVISLEFLRRVQREYEAFIRRQDQKKDRQRLLGQVNESQSTSESGEGRNDKRMGAQVIDRFISPTTSMNPGPQPEKATLLQRQVIRSLLHMLQFGVAYFIMLLAMYYNGK
jgi:solute carrier family 31 (copper transporter), member 1